MAVRTTVQNLETCWVTITIFHFDCTLHFTWVAHDYMRYSKAALLRGMNHIERALGLEGFGSVRAFWAICLNSCSSPVTATAAAVTALEKICMARHACDDFAENAFSNDGRIILHSINPKS